MGRLRPEPVDDGGLPEDDQLAPRSEVTLPR
ncbi:hypothetical protein FHS42_001551 [Streptomyces zagrosensis]|uniref:Uncharacterized protein n=1 Tax=Streptomyces zagrosensis TaxID=1042984 RepID=A0A7W9Q6F9_9ACTN|nr:hypothetical protein [Streptomyces zagrosensis]